VKRSADFIERLYIAAHWEAYVASAFTREGFHVILGPARVGPDPKVYAQSIDLHVCHRNDPDDLPHIESGAWQPVEVKGTAPRVENGLVLVCSEHTFNNKTKEDDLYATYVFCSPKTGKMWGLLDGTPIIRGHTQTDSYRGSTYNVIKADARNLIPFSDIAKALR
jgi:hypothetical protein